MGSKGRRGGLLGAALAAVAISGCGGGDDADSPLDRALGYLPADAALTVSVSTDLESEAYANLDVALQRFGVPGGLQAALADALESEEVTFPEVEPLLGNELVFAYSDLAGGLISPDGSEEPAFTAAIELADGQEATDLLARVESLEEADGEGGETIYVPAAPEAPLEFPEADVEPAPGPALAIEDDVLVIAQTQDAVQDALARSEAGEGLGEETFVERLGDLPDDALLRASADAQVLLDAAGADVATGVPWIAAQESLGLTATVSEEEVSVELLASGGEVSEDQLPIAAGADGPSLYADQESLANLDQSQTIAFLLEAISVSVPSAAFDEVSGRIADEAGADPAALAEAFGSGVRVQNAAGDTLSRSEVNDPEVVSEALRGLHDQVPRLAELQAGGEPASSILGLASALAPALPLPDGYFPEGSKVAAVAGEPDLYRLVGPSQRFAPPPDEYVFGLIGDVFVTGPNLEQARRMAASEPDAEIDLPGAVAGSVPINAGDFDFDAAEGSNVALTVVELALEATGESLRLRLRAGL